jgi:5'-nucleotidase
MEWVDMDGVLADFDKAYFDRFGTVAKETPDKVLWPNINKIGDFFATLPLMLGAERLWMAVGDNARILTALSKSDPECLGQKLHWLKVNLGVKPWQVTAVTGKKNKKLFCTPGDVLIDDNEQNIADWKCVGGYGILFKNTDQAIRELVYGG